MTVTEADRMRLAEKIEALAKQVRSGIIEEMEYVEHPFGGILTWIAQEREPNPDAVS